MFEPLSQQIATLFAITPTEGAAGVSDINGTTLDMQAYGAEAVLITVVMGAITTNAVTSLKVQGSDAAAFSDPVDLTGSAQTIADNKDEKIFQIDVINPPTRYVRVLIDRATQNAVVVAALYQVYRIRNKPVTQGADVTLEVHRNKIAGTA